VTPTDGEQISHRAPKWVRWLFLLVILIAVAGFIPVAMDHNYGNLVLTSEWVARAHTAGLIFASLYTAVACVLLAMGIRMTHRAKTVPLWANVLTGLVMPVLLFMLGYMTIVATYPAITAGWSNERFGYIVTVQEVSTSGGRHCRTRIELRDMPFLFDYICTRNAEAAKLFKPGQQITIVGEGTANAIFAEDIRY